MLWQVHYISGGIADFRLICGRANAIDGACALLDAGRDVLRINTARNPEIIGALELREIHAQRKASRLR